MQKIRRGERTGLGTARTSYCQPLLGSKTKNAIKDVFINIFFGATDETGPRIINALGNILVFHVQPRSYLNLRFLKKLIYFGY